MEVLFIVIYISSPFDKHPYGGSVIGSMEDLNSAKQRISGIL